MTDYIEPSNADIAAAPDSVQGYLDNLIAERDTLADRAAELEAALNTILSASEFYSHVGTDGIAALKGADHD